jgi:sulfoacetaldehyde dehydrogenase
MSRTDAQEERQHARELLEKARAAMRSIEQYDQAGVDRVCRAIAWATYNEPTAKRLANMSVDESGL